MAMYFMRLGEERQQKPYHFQECGLDTVFLVNGFEIHDTPEGEGISITDIDGLHDAIAKCIVERGSGMTGKEVRFLRKQIDLTQAELAKLIRIEVQSVQRWEKGKTKVPGPADLLLRAFYLSHRYGDINVQEIAATISELDADARCSLRKSEDEHWCIAA